MGKINDLTGKRFGKLLIVKRAENNSLNRACWECLCDCGNTRVYVGQTLIKGRATSCGCTTRKKDLTNKRFGKLMVIGELKERTSNGKVRWECLCDCGSTIEVVGTYLTKGSTTSCGCARAEDIHGKKFGRLLVEKRVGSNSDGKALWECLCDCGNKVEVTGKSLRTGRTKSCGCLQKEKAGTNNQKSVEEHLKDCILMHEGKYTYDEKLTLDKGVYTSLKIICPEHGEFQQMLYAHKSGQGCPICGRVISKAEEEITCWLSSLLPDLDIERNIKFQFSKCKMELDIYLPKFKLGIEYHGLYWHSTEYRDKHYHQDKYKLFKDLGIQVIQIFENEWVFNKEIVKSILKSKLNLNKVIYARKCSIQTLTSKQYKQFVEENHIQGFTPAEIKLGLFHDEELMQVMSFGIPRYNSEYDWENIRTCTKLGYSVVGGFSKLLTHFKINYSGTIISYIDLRYFSGNGYLNNGFSILKSTSPNYFYFKKNSLKLESRVKYQKHKLKDLLDEFDSKKSEKENMEDNNYNRIFDAGNLVVVFR